MKSSTPQTQPFIEHVPAQTDILSTQLGGIANLALLAPVKAGFVEGYESITYAKRLEALLKTVNAIRLASREASLIRNPFPDAVGRIGILQSFRYAVVPPELGSEMPEPVPAPRSGAELEPGTYRLSLNVTFDGGWEPYIRVIHRDLGPLLDAIFCNCAGYPVTRSHNFDQYTRWVRSHEIPGGLFYAESSMTVLDQRYLTEVEKIEREQREGAAAADAARVRFGLQEPPSPQVSAAAFAKLPAPVQQLAMKLNLKALKGLYDLKTFYPENSDGDHLTLLRFTQSVFQEFRLVLPDAANLPPSLMPFAPQIAWLKSDLVKAQPAERPVKLAYDKATPCVQGGIVSRYDRTTHGCMVLLRVTDAAEARRFLAGLELSREGHAQPGGIQRNAALTLQGLKALGVPKWRIDMFPHEFLEGMEARAGLLGDVRGNHPENWRRPKFEGDPKKRELDLGAVHIVLQYRLSDTANPGHDLHPALAAEVAKLRTAQGIRLLATEPMRSYLDPEKPTINREHFGFRDGLSQPVISDAPREPKPAFEWDDKVARGEVFLGYANDRGDGPFPLHDDTLLDNGTFLAVRKLKENVVLFNDVLRREAEAQLPPAREGEDPQAREAQIGQRVFELKAKLMGRDPQGGAPAAPQIADPVENNVFDYGKDPQGKLCPFHSHARRANPRLELPTPRIIRRGMSYGPPVAEAPDAERGLYFMAYCASIAEQFEVIQRWVAGGNSSGGLSAHSDPFLGVPQAGEDRIYEYFDSAGVLRRVNLGSAPFTELQWGVYLFVPSATALKRLDAIVAEAPKPARDAAPAPGRKSAPQHPDFPRWQQLIEDPNERDKTWAHVYQAQGRRGEQETPYGTLVAKQSRVLEALNDNGKTLSACGYGRRFKDTIGDGYLGMDGREHDHEAETPAGNGVNDAIADVTVEDAFEKAFGVTTALLADSRFFPPTPHAARPGSVERSVDIVALSELAMARLCSIWFGLPDEQQAFMGDRTAEGSAEVRCPDFLVAVSRYVFWPYPSEAEAEEARTKGRAIREMMPRFLEAAAKRGPGAPRLGELAQKIKTRLAGHAKKDATIVPRTIAGTMLGFAPTVHLNFLRVMKAWAENHATTPSSEPKTSLWDLQAELLMEKEPGKVPSAMLRDALFAQMRLYPAPELIWREPPGAKLGPHGEEPPKTVLGLEAVMKNDPEADPVMMFGGARKSGCPAHAARSGQRGHEALQTVHACPGYDMGVGVMLGMVSALLLAEGTLRPTASPTILNIVSLAPPAG